MGAAYDDKRQARGIYEFRTSNDPDYLPLSNWSLYQRSLWLRHLTVAELEWLDYSIAVKYGSGKFFPETAPLDYEPCSTPMEPSDGGFWNHASSAYDEHQHLKPIVENWDKLRRAALRFINDLPEPIIDHYHFRTKQEIIAGWDSWQLENFGLWKQAEKKRKEENRMRRKREKERKLLLQQLKNQNL